MAAVGAMPMPENFKYACVCRRGKPRHELCDAFGIRHPRMDVGHRAKIFSAFDALKGFSEAIGAREIVYMDRIELSREDQEELNRRLTILREQTRGGGLTRSGGVRVEVTFYEACADEAEGFRGRYRTATGICRQVDEVCCTLRLDDRIIEFEDLLRIEEPGGMFDRDAVRPDGI